MASNWVRGNLNTTCVILDTSAILMPFEFSIDIEKELERLLGRFTIVIPQAVLDELNMIDTRGSGRKHRQAHAAYTWVQRFQSIPTSKYGDDAVVEAAQQKNAYVVTNDRELRSRLRKLSIPTITLRQKQYLILEE